MGVRKLEGRPEVPVNVRVSASMKTAMDNAADKLRISTAQYIRMAIQEKLDRDCLPSDSDQKIRELIRDELRRLNINTS